MRRFWRCGIAALWLLTLFGGAQAGYVPVPNGTGSSVRSAINDRFGGTVGTEPQIDTYTVATLPTEVDQKVIWVSNAQPGVATCTAGGTGTIAIGVSGFWNCGTTAQINAAQTTITGTTAGSAVCSQPFQSPTYKKVVCYLNGYNNTSGSAQTYTFPTAFASTDQFTANSDPLSSISLSVLTLPASMSGPVTSEVVVEGY